MKCAHCGRENDDNTMFCGFCGSSLRIPKEYDRFFSEDFSLEEKRERTMRTQQSNPRQSYSSYKKSLAEKKKKQRERDKRLMITAASVLAAIIVIVFTAARTQAGKAGTSIGAPNGNITGVVLDENNEPVKDAVVKLYNSDQCASEPVHKTYTDKKGRYALKAAKGDYVLCIEDNAKCRRSVRIRKDREKKKLGETVLYSCPPEVARKMLIDDYIRWITLAFPAGYDKTAGGDIGQYAEAALGYLASSSTPFPFLTKTPEGCVMALDALTRVIGDLFGENAAGLFAASPKSASSVVKTFAVDENNNVSWSIDPNYYYGFAGFDTFTYDETDTALTVTAAVYDDPVHFTGSATHTMTYTFSKVTDGDSLFYRLESGYPSDPVNEGLSLR